MASWSEAAAAQVAAPARRPRPRPAAKPRPAVPRRRPATSRRTANGVLWIVLAAGVLAGVVALNVAVLQRNLALDRLARERADLRSDNAALVSQLSSASAALKIEQAARARGLVPADPASFTYVDIARPAK